MNETRLANMRGIVLVVFFLLTVNHGLCAFHVGFYSFWGNLQDYLMGYGALVKEWDGRELATFI